MSNSKFAGILNAAKSADAEQPEETAPPVGPPAAPRKVGRPAVGKRSNAEYEQVSLYLRRDTHTAAKIRLLQDGDRRDLSEVVEELLAAWLGSR